MNLRIIRNLLLVAVLAFAFRGNSQYGAKLTISDACALSVEAGEMSDVACAHKLNLPDEEFRICDFSHLGAPVQESIVSVRRVESSRSEESAEDINVAVLTVSVPARHVRIVAVNNRHSNSALCHSSRFYINKFGTLLI